MTIQPLADRIGTDLARLVASLGEPVAAIDEITTLPSPVHDHRTYRVTLADGRMVKARRLASSTDVQRVVLLRSDLPDDRFSRIVAANGAVLLEEWVVGRALTPADTEDHLLLRWCGEALAAAHVAPVPRHVPGSWPLNAQQHLVETRFHLGELVRARSLSRRAAGALSNRAGRHVPRNVKPGIVHRDLWWGNVVATTAHGWRVIDNETLDIAAPELDLARTRYAWPMSDPAWAALIEGYATHCDPSRYASHAAFWDLVVVAEAAAYRRAARTRGVNRPLALLRAMAEDASDDHPSDPSPAGAASAMTKSVPPARRTIVAG